MTDPFEVHDIKPRSVKDIAADAGRAYGWSTWYSPSLGKWQWRAWGSKGAETGTTESRITADGIAQDAMERLK